MTMIRNNRIQFASPEAIRAFQEERLRETLRYLEEHSRFYREMFRREGIDPRDIRTLDDLQRLPVTTKEQLQLRNDDFRCVAPRQIIDYVTTSGTLGDPVTFALTEGDLDRLAYNEMLSFTTARMWAAPAPTARTWPSGSTVATWVLSLIQLMVAAAPSGRSSQDSLRVSPVSALRVIAPSSSSASLSPVNRS